MSILDELDIHKQYDTEDMYHKIIHMPEHIMRAYFEPKVHYPEHFEHIKLTAIQKIVICGMGGSAISADIAKRAFSSTIPICVVKDYDIPLIDEFTLVIACSYSGHTEETLTCLEKALKETEFIAAISVGGKLKDILKEDYLWLELQCGFPPRSAIGYLFFSLLKVLELFKVIPDQSAVVKSTVANLIKKAGAISYKVPELENFAKNSAENMKGFIPIIYSTSPDLEPIAYRWKCQINENTKYPAFYHTFPEMNHNEIEAWECNHYDDVFKPVFLNNMSIEPRYKNRVTAFKKILEQKNIEYLDFYTEGDSLIERIFSLIYLGDMISYYLAILYKTNPTGIKYIEFLKKEITRG